ncbi:J domain-containing protein [Ramlibacter sp. Leaf400]|uniref:J domain-containing protein n=1 Tax=Ramlibacter sp. Leaf400 TaxID=1736365 RepID=UPI0006FDE620|nr:J domain-containing protein [Ramlibacter sp. Leaf400]KQT11329.1 hypothetical protein ASG30_05495 [Ramlibacter sp. Leaf400]
MSNAALQSLQIQPCATDPVLAQQQTRFNALVRQLELGRAALAGWKERIDRYHQAVEPVRRELHAAWRQWAFALDHAGLQPGLTRAERAQLDELLREATTALLEVEDDAGLEELARRHEEGSSCAQSGREDAADEAGDEELPEEDPAQDWEQQAARASAQRAEWAAKRRTASARKRRQQAAQEVSRSLRDVYRRLASALHPDREPDARQRGRKTALMQQANQAYAEGNLLALLELQLQAEEVDAAHLAGVDPRRLQHYVTVLQEQLTDLQSETRRLETGFRAAVGVAPGWGLQPRRADRLISSEAQRLRGELQLLQRQTRLLGDLEATKTWLREVRSARH